MESSRLTFSLASVVALFGACTTYGAGDGKSDPGPKTPIEEGGVGDASPADGAGGTSDAAPVVDGSPDETYTTACPPCAAGDTCIPAGCSGAGPNNTCSNPYDIIGTKTVIVFACPEGPSAMVPNEPACSGGGAKHGAILRLGNASAWKVQVSGQSPFLLLGDCQTNTGGGCSTSSVTKDVAALRNVFVGTTATLTTCMQLKVTVTAQ